MERWGGACKLSSLRNTKDWRKMPKSGPFDIYLFICLHSSQASKVLSLSSQVDEE